MSSGYPGPRTALRLRVAANGEAREFTVTDMKDASEVFRGWIRKNDLGSRDLEPEAGEVYDTGTGRVVGRVAYNGRIVLPNPRRARKNPGGVYHRAECPCATCRAEYQRLVNAAAADRAARRPVPRCSRCHLEGVDTVASRVNGKPVCTLCRNVELESINGTSRPTRGNPPRFREGDIVRMRGADPYSGRRAGQLGVATLVAGARGKSVYPDPAHLMLFCHWDDGVETSVWARSAEKIGRVTFKSKADMIGQFTRFARSRA